MSDTAVIVILWVNIVESLVVFSGNIFTIFVFWKYRNKLKRTSFLLINLADADLLVGFVEAVRTGTLFIPQHQLENHMIINYTSYRSILASFQTAFSYASVYFLVIISVERAYALIWPLRHRVAGMKGHIYSVVFVWVAGVSIGTSSLLAVHGILDLVQWIVAYCCDIALGLITICDSYLAIRTRLKISVPAEDNVHNRQNSQEQIKKLSRTLFIVISISLVCWFPGIVINCVRYLCSECFSSLVIRILNMLRLANSLVNPIIYCFRMPIFRQTLKQMMPCKQSKKYTVNPCSRNCHDAQIWSRRPCHSSSVDNRYPA